MVIFLAATFVYVITKTYTYNLLVTIYNKILYVIGIQKILTGKSWKYVSLSQ